MNGVRGMTITVLGSGTGIPDPRRGAPAYHVAAPGWQGLVDCGSGALRQLARAGGDFRLLDGVFITHLHMDHVGDLMPLIHARAIPWEGVAERPLTLYGPPGLAAFHGEVIQRALNVPQGFPLQVVEVDGPVTLGEGLRVTRHPTCHSARLTSFAYRFQWGEVAAGFTGDADDTPGLGRFFQGVALLVADCAFPDVRRVAGHFSGTGCGLLARAARPGRLLLSHLYPVPGGEAARLAECRAVHDGPVALAEDLQVIRLGI